ncbi:unnamed protein product [Rhizophagus irregularis]|nr:unnamed protein product [Rhizophagus irregularis]
MFAAYGYSSNSAGLLSPVHIPSMKDNIIPFIKLLKITLLIRTLISNEWQKAKRFRSFGYSDIFILSDTGNNYVILELKYISLVGLNINQKNNLGSNELENLDKILKKENLLKRPYSYWSKEIKTTIGEILNNGIDQLNSYMKVISKGKATNYSSSGIFDRRIKVSKSNPNKLKGFVVLVIGFRRILWKSVDDVTTNYTYNKV